MITIITMRKDILNNNFILIKRLQNVRIQSIWPIWMKLNKKNLDQIKIQLIRPQ